MRPEIFERFYSACERFLKKKGHLYIPADYTEEGYRLGSRVNIVRSKKNVLTEEQKKRLNELGFVWRVRCKQQRLTTDEVLELMKEYVKKHHTSYIGAKYVNDDGIRLGAHMLRIRQGSIRITPKQRKGFEEIGVAVKPYYKIRYCDDVIALIVEYNRQHGNTKIRQDYVTKDGVMLGRMVNRIRMGTIKLSDAQKETLEELHFPWEGYRSITIPFHVILESLIAYRKKFGTVDVPYEYYDTERCLRLGEVLQSIRYGARHLNNNQDRQLRELGVELLHTGDVQDC